MAGDGAVWVALRTTLSSTSPTVGNQERPRPGVWGHKPGGFLALVRDSCGGFSLWKRDGGPFAPSDTQGKSDVRSVRLAKRPVELGQGTMLQRALDQRTSIGGISDWTWRGSGMMGKRLRVMAGLAAVALVAVACKGGGGTSNQGKIFPGGILRVGTSSTIDSLNPFVGFQANAYLVWQYTYPYLGEYDAHNNLVPYWAKSWSVSPDGLTWTFDLPANTKWSDGKPLTASDAAFTFSTVIKWQNTITVNWGSNVTNMKDAVATSPTTLVIHYAKPSGNALSQMLTLPILPQHVWGQYATGDGKALKTFLNAPQNGQPVVSGGPFMLVEYKKDQIALLKRNPNWWGTSKPHIDGFGIEIFSNDDAMIIAFKDGQLDAVEDIPTTDVKVLQSAGFKLNITLGVFFYDFIINSNPQKLHNQELLNPTVRLAFDYAFDRQQIINTALNGYGQVGSAFIPPATGKWYDPSIHPMPFDLNKANQLLDSLGFKKGSNGIRIANGHPMSYTVVIPTSRQGVLTRTFQIIQPDFKQIGVQLTLKVLDPSAMFAAETANNYRNFDLGMWDWIPSVDPSYILSVLMCNQFGQNNDPGYCNHSYDQLWHKQASTVDQQQRLQIVYQMENMIFNTRAYTVLNYPDIIDVYNPKKWGGFVNEQGFGILINNGTQSLLNVHQVG